jgi:hypothetical protein
MKKFLSLNLYKCDQTNGTWEQEVLDEAEACQYAVLQHSADLRAGEHGPGRRAVAQEQGAAVGAAVMHPDHKDQREAEGPDGLVEVAAAHLHLEERHVSMG